MIDTRSLYPYRNKFETYDEEHALKTDLYNHTYTFLNRGLTEMFSNYLAKTLWTNFLQRPLAINQSFSIFTNFEILKNIYEQQNIGYLFAFIEFLHRSLKEFSEITHQIIFSGFANNLESDITGILQRLGTGLTFCSGIITQGMDHTSQTQVQTALSSDDHSTQHINNALDALSVSGPQKTDLCIREAINAVEYIIKKKLNVSTLTDGTKILKGMLLQDCGNKPIHTALLKSLEIYYGYTSDIARHSIDESPSTEEAQLALAICAAWVNYLRKVLPNPEPKGTR